MPKEALGVIRARSMAMRGANEVSRSITDFDSTRCYPPPGLSALRVYSYRFRLSPHLVSSAGKAMGLSALWVALWVAGVGAIGAVAPK